MRPGSIPNFVSDFRSFTEATQTSLDDEPNGSFAGVSKGILRIYNHCLQIYSVACNNIGVIGKDGLTSLYIPVTLMSTNQPQQLFAFLICSLVLKLQYWKCMHAKNKIISCNFILKSSDLDKEYCLIESLHQLENDTDNTNYCDQILKYIYMCNFFYFFTILHPSDHSSFSILI